jgi:hypothetical protein
MKQKYLKILKFKKIINIMKIEGLKKMITKDMKKMIAITKYKI